MAKLGKKHKMPSEIFETHIFDAVGTVEGSEDVSVENELL